MLKKVLEQVLQMPHFSNAQGQHEDAIESLLIGYKFKQSNLDAFGMTKQQVREATAKTGVAPLMFIPQPCGSQSFPDFIVSDSNGRVHYIECKSSKSDKIVWNSGTPKKGAIYVVSSGKYDRQTLVRGDDFWSKQERALMTEAFQKMREIQNKYHGVLKGMGSNLQPYCRPMNNDSNKIYDNPDRERRVQAVFSHIK